MGARWQPHQDALLARLYDAGTPLRQIAERLQRSEDAVTNRRHVLGIHDRRGRWSPAQDAVIVTAAEAGLQTSSVAAHLGLPADRVRRRRAQLVGARPPSRRYDAAEDEAIRGLWARQGDVEALARRLGRSAEAIRLRALALGVHEPVARKRWTATEDDALLDGYAAGLSGPQITGRLLHGRTNGAAEARAAKLGLGNYARRWSERDDRRLIALASAGVPIYETSLYLVRSQEALRQRARRLGISPPPVGAQPRAGQPWRLEEDTVLRSRASSSPAVLSRVLGRSDQAVRCRMEELDLLASRGRTPHYPLPPTSGLTPGQHAVAARALNDRDASGLLAVARRLRLSPGRLRREAEQSSSSAQAARAA